MTDVISGNVAGKKMQLFFNHCHEKMFDEEGRTFGIKLVICLFSNMGMLII